MIITKSEQLTPGMIVKVFDEYITHLIQVINVGHEILYYKILDFGNKETYINYSRTYETNLSSLLNGWNIEWVKSHNSALYQAING